MTAVWLATAQSLVGTMETPGVTDNPTILGWSKVIATAFPDLAAYTKEYSHDSIPWCGDFVAYCLAKNGIKPVTKADGAKYGFLWADDWKYFGVPSSPKMGCIMVFTRNGGGHVAFYVGEDATRYKVIGGNQSDAVNVMWIAKTKFTAARWPKSVPVPYEPPVQPELPLPPVMPEWHSPFPDVEPPEAPTEPVKPNEDWTITKIGGAIISGGGASVLAFINSPYALGALALLLVFGYFIFREYQRKKAK